MSRKIADILWMALENAKGYKQSLIDAYRGDTSEWVVRDALSDIKAFEALQLKLFGTTRNRGQAMIDRMKPVDILKLMEDALIADHAPSESRSEPSE